MAERQSTEDIEAWIVFALSADLRRKEEAWVGTFAMEKWRGEWPESLPRKTSVYYVRYIA